MAEASAQYEAWPSGSTTDGTVIDLITRMDETTLEAIGMTYIDFGGDLFPSRVVVTVEEAASSIVGFIGQIDDRTGAPPRLPAGTLINTPRDPDTGIVTPTLIIGHREVLPVWTRAFTLSVADGSTGHDGSIRPEN